MRVLFVEARKRFSPEIKEQLSRQLSRLEKKLRGKKIGLLASLQYLDLLNEAKKVLKGVVAKGNIARHAGQVLGCDIEAAKQLQSKVDAFLFIGSGRYHALQLATALNKPVFVWQPGFELDAIKSKEIETAKQLAKTSLARFLTSDQLGILVSIKPGQQHLNTALLLKKRLEKKEKRAFIFLADTINIAELENFSPTAWLNTACPTLVLDASNIVNAKDIERFI